MEASEARKLQEPHEHAARDRSLHPAASGISLLAVVLAMLAVPGHHSPHRAALHQARASDPCNFFRAREFLYAQLTADPLNCSAAPQSAFRRQVLNAYQARFRKWNRDLNQSKPRPDLEPAAHPPARIPVPEPGLWAGGIVAASLEFTIH